MEWKITTAGLIMTALVGTSLTVDHITAARDTAAQNADAVQDARDLNVGRVLPRTPVNALRTFASLVAQDVPEQACLGLDAPAAAQLATQHGAPDCPAAARLIRAQVTAVNDWIEFAWTTTDQRTHPDGTATMDGCAVTFPWVSKPRTADPGPRIGWLTLRQVGGGGYLITRVEPCPTAPSSPSTASTSTTAPPGAPAATPAPARPGLLPVYPPAIPAMLAARIADASTGVCAYFTPAGRTQFAQAANAADCEAAITTLHKQVTDPRHYHNPDIGGARTTPGPGNRVTVDGCALRWTTFGKPASAPPGPRIGRLVLEHPPGDHIGYLIAGYTPCP